MPKRDIDKQTRCPFCQNSVSDAARAECGRAGIIVVMCSKCLTEYFRFKQFDKELSSLVATLQTQGVKVGR